MVNVVDHLGNLVYQISMNRFTMFAAGVLLAACGQPSTTTTPTEPSSETASESAPAASPQRTDSMIVVRVAVRVQPASTDAFVAHLTREAEQTRALPGCQRFELFRDPQDPNRFLLYEEWASAADFEAYQNSDLLRESFAVLGPMMAGPPDSTYFDAQVRPRN